MSNPMDLDTTLAEDSVDLPVGDWDEDLLDGFPDDDPAAQAPSATPSAKPAAAGEPRRGEDAAGTGDRGKAGRSRRARATVAVEPRAAPIAPAAAASPRLGSPQSAVVRRAADGPGFGAGLFFGLLVLLAGLMLGAGVLVASGGAPDRLLDRSGLADWQRIGDFAAQPTGAFWLSLALVLAIALVAVAGVGRRLSGLHATIAAQDDLLAAVCALDADDPATWRQEILQTDPEIVAATSNLLGHFNLQQARLARYVGLEGELHRLEKAMADDSVVDLQAGWENPCAGSLADQALRLVHKRGELAGELAAHRQEFADQGLDLVAGLRDARSWQTATLEQVAHQGAAVERLSRKLGKLAPDRPDDGDLARRRERLALAVSALRDELATLPAQAARGSGRDDPDRGTLAPLVERSSRLAFQIAMEVARLGAKGERLLPLTQDLEELTTEWRSLADRAKAEPGGEDQRDRVIDRIRGRLGDLDPQAIQPAASAGDAASLIELAPDAAESSAALAKVSQMFGVQTSRLKALSELATRMTGIEADDLGDPEAQPGSNMLVDRFDPFAARNQPDGMLVADPFASSGGSIFDAAPAADQEFAHRILPGEESRLLNASVPEPSVLDLSSPPPAEPEPEPEPEPAPPPTPRALAARDEPELPSVAERVYDLAEFDAHLLPPDPNHDEAESRVYDLSEFAAVRID